MRTYRVTWPVSEIIDDALAAQNLQALIIVTPGPNSNPEEVAGNRLRRLPGYVYEWANFDPGPTRRP